MKYCEKTIKKIRSLLSDLNVNESFNLFSNEELTGVLDFAESENHALYILFIQKAGKITNDSTAIKAIKQGSEEVTRLDALDLTRIALKQAEKYKELWESEKKNGSIFIY